MTDRKNDTNAMGGETTERDTTGDTERVGVTGVYIAFRGFRSCQRLSNPCRGCDVKFGQDRPCLTDHASSSRPPQPEPAIPWRVRTRQMLADLAATARLVWSASPGLLSLILALSIVLALVPAASLWVGKLLLDEVARAISGGFPSAADAYRRLAIAARPAGRHRHRRVTRADPVRHGARAARRYAAESHQPADTAQSGGARRRKLRECRDVRRAAQRVQRSRLAAAWRDVSGHRHRPGV